MNQKIRGIGAGILVTVWCVLIALCWFAPAKAASESERRPLAQWPQLSGQTLLGGKFMTAFEDYTLDQFPMRDSFRKLKSLFHTYILRQKDNHNIYIADGYAAALEYPLNTPSVERALGIFQNIYDKYLKDTGSVIYSMMIPDKGYYLAEKNGYPVMDYKKLEQTLREGMPWASYIDITQKLDITNYYYTDTHWRQETLLPVAQTIAQAMGLTQPKLEDYTEVAAERPFYGVYYGQAALPMEPETLYYLESSLLNDCKVYNYETGSYGAIYDMAALAGKDPYEMYLSGPQAILRIENPNATTERKLIIFRDSFSSSLAPLLVQDYAEVTLVDVRYVNSFMLDKYLTFTGQDVLFAYSTLVLNDSDALK